MNWLLKLYRFVWKQISGYFAKPKVFGTPRSSQWRKVRHAHLNKYPTCAVCGKREKLEVHHVIPFQFDSSKECDPSNLVTLCDTPCHFLFGHLNDWKSYNAEVRDDAARMLAKIRSRPDHLQHVD